MKPRKSEHENAPTPASMFNGPTSETWERNVSLAGDNVRSLQQETLRFATQRLEQNTKAFQEIASCKSLPEVVAIQQKWFADMTRAYSEEWARCSEIFGSALHTSDSASRDTARERRHRTEH